MKIVYKISVLGFFVLPNLFAQAIIYDKNTINKSNVKTNELDSLYKISFQKKVIEYKKYIGQKLYFAPISKKHNTQKIEIINYLTTIDSIQVIKSGKIPFEKLYFYSEYKDEKLKLIPIEKYENWKKEYENIDKEITNVYEPKFYHVKTDATYGKIYGEFGTLPEKVENKYFTILDIKVKTFYGKEFLKLEAAKVEELEDKVALKITLKNEETNDTIYWNIDQSQNIKKYPFYLTSYLENRLQLHLNKNLVALKKINNLTDINTGEIITITKGQKWYCSDIRFTDTTKSTHIKPYYFLTNGKNEFQIDLEDITNEGFITYEDYIEIEIQNKKVKKN
jgi:hypothetical protein